ncbi:PEP phosphonomutase-like enzyme [Mizugakiibacter sediminis]|uniref:PEP phosphonomutase-like enzyme n=1 Tax=Mizugakiibacter sediminis TaxID=1475481 RepID=A0A0K8QJT2_9GAMM|nr:isocitrate lyase/phosphoenolpyruvate mutase family protein [Mizugakiibacter sediminis]GAP65175.1 PEP phosphonomutase-like enzyme [Mizugakiibacter sediminis]
MFTPTLAERRTAFRRLHERGCFVMPNAWDPGSARALQQLGFAAIASTSAGFAFSRGRADGAVGVDEVLAHLRDLVAATPLPVNADFEDGHARDLDALAANVRRCVDTGVAGLSIEDASGDAAQPLYPLEEAVARLRAARAAIDAAGGEVLLVARAECFLVGHPDPLAESLRRLTAYAEAGADCLFAPGLRTEAEIAAVVAAVAPKPVNVLVGSAAPFDVARLAALGVRRISVGGALARAAWTGFLHAARALAEGRFDGFAGATPHAELNAMFREAPRD